MLPRRGPPNPGALRSASGLLRELTAALPLRRFGPKPDMGRCRAKARSAPHSGTSCDLEWLTAERSPSGGIRAKQIRAEIAHNQQDASVFISAWVIPIR